MSSYSQLGQKRQKVREVRTEAVDYFQGIEKVEFSRSCPLDGGRYGHYRGAERVGGRGMEDWLKYSLSLSSFKGNGSDKAGKPTFQRPWDDNTNTLENCRRCIKACFDFCSKLGIKYWTAFDSDLIPAGEWEENRSNWEEIVEFVQENVQRTQVKPLWIAPDLHSHPRYASGAITSNDATTFLQAAAQIKKCLEISQRLSCECFLIWPYREGYDAIFKSDIAREMKLFAKLLKMAADHKEKLNYRCQMLLMPYYHSNCFSNYYYGQSWREIDRINRYMWDGTSCMFLLKNYNLERFYKVCLPPGHQMVMANVYNMLGGVVITDEMDDSDTKNFTLMMKSIVDQGSCPPGGISLQLQPRRDSLELRELVACYVKYIDAVAKGLRVACNIASEQIFSKHVQQKYATYCSGPGARLLSGDLSLEECEEHHKKNQHQSESSSAKSEHLDVVFQRYMDSCEQI